MKRVWWTALPVLLAIAPASHAQSVGYEETLEAAISGQPQVRTSELRLDARREIAEKDEIPQVAVDHLVRGKPRPACLCRQTHPLPPN